MPEVAESTSDTNGFYDSALRRCAEWQHGWRCHGFLSEWREGSILFLWSRLFRLPLTVCAPYKDRVESLYFRSFPITFREGFRLCPSKQHLFIKFLSSYWRLRICSDRFLNVILHEGHSCPKLQNPPLMRMGFSVPFKRPINLSHTELLGRNHLQLSPFHFFSLSLPTSGRI